MPPSDRPKQKPLASRKGSLVLRLDRAAGELNPFLVVLAIGLLILNVTLYLGMAAARQPDAWNQPHTAGLAGTAAAAAMPAPDPQVPRH
ncbi:MAG: hypothetical protein JO032_16500 [Alphaproteobacteria bacterium]|nr:hypothetical protein [Alphaproteobacteria bacterium]MBV9554382.1 hypothetical protein [Alphaproteobacteria bacterium]